MERKTDLQLPPIDDPNHPCFDCGNRQSEDTKAIMTNDTICLRGFTPKVNCPYFIPIEPVIKSQKDIK